MSPSGRAGSITTASAPARSGQLPDPAGEVGLGQQDRLPRPDHPEGLLAVPPGRARVGGGEDRDVVGRQPAPQLPQVRLDPPDLGGKVVRQQDVAHCRLCLAAAGPDLADGAMPSGRARPAPRRTYDRARPGRAPKGRRRGGQGPRWGRPRARPGLGAERPTRHGPAAVRPGRRGTASVSTRPGGERAVGRVGQGDQGIAAQVPGVASGDVPAAVRASARRRWWPASPGGPPRSGPERADAGSPAAVPQRHPVGRAYLLTVVAAVDAAAQGHPVLEREHPRCLQEPGQAPAGVQHPRLHESTRRAGPEAPPARPAAVGHRASEGQRRVRDHGAEDEPRTPPGQQDVASFCRTIPARPS